MLSRLIKSLQSELEQHGNHPVIINGNQEIIAIYLDTPDDPIAPDKECTWTPFISIDTKKMTETELMPYKRKNRTKLLPNHQLLCYNIKNGPCEFYLINQEEKTYFKVEDETQTKMLQFLTSTMIHDQQSLTKALDGLTKANTLRELGDRSLIKEEPPADCKMTRERVLQIAKDITKDMATIRQLRSYVTVWALDNNISVDYPQWNCLIQDVFNIVKDDEKLSTKPTFKSLSSDLASNL